MILAVATPAAAISAAVAVSVAAASAVVIVAVSVAIAGAKNGTKKKHNRTPFLGPSPLFDMHICNLHFY